MASNINSTDIDAEYPIAGQDNDSQGFRDNFSTIKNSLATAKSEITDLQDNAARKDGANNFAGNEIRQADFIEVTEKIYSTGNITASQNISFENGNYQTLQIGGDITLTLADWPDAGKMGRIRLQITSNEDGTPRTITWSANPGEIKTGTSWPVSFQVSSQTNPVIVDFWTVNGGLIVFGQYHGLFD